MSEMNREARAAAYFDFLANEGYRPSYDKDGDVAFKCEGGHYIVIVDDDQYYVRLVFPNFFKVDSDVIRERALLVSNEVCVSTKVVKVNVVGDDVWASVELFVPEPDAFATVFERCMSVLRSGAGEFSSRMRELAEMVVDPSEVN